MIESKQGRNKCDCSEVLTDILGKFDLLDFENIYLKTKQNKHNKTKQNKTKQKQKQTMFQNNLQ